MRRPRHTKEHLLVSKALPIFRPHTTSAPLATYHFCMRSIVPVLRLKFGKRGRYCSVEKGYLNSKRYVISSE
jgi:hypothetical protein